MEFFLYTWPIKKIKNEKKCQISVFARVWLGRGVFWKKIVYEDQNQTENFIGVKIENDIYYKSEKYY